VDIVKAKLLRLYFNEFYFFSTKYFAVGGEEICGQTVGFWAWYCWNTR